MVDKVTPILDRITQYRVFLLLASLILAADVAMAALLGRGVASLEATGEGIRAGPDGSITLGGTLLFAAAYAFFMSGAGRFLRHAVEWALLWPKIRIAEFFRDDRGRGWWHSSGRYIRLSRLREKATERKDAVYLKIAEDREQENQRSAERDAGMSTASFLSAALAVADWWVGAPTALGTLHEAMAASATRMVSVNADAALAAIVMAMAAPWAVLYWFREQLDDAAEWVDCPAAVKEFAETGEDKAGHGVMFGSRP